MPEAIDAGITVAAIEVATGVAAMVGTAGAIVAEAVAEGVAVVVEGDTTTAVGGDVELALTAGTVACWVASLAGRATAAPLSAPVVLAVAMPAACDLICADALPIMIAAKSAAVTKCDAAWRLGK